MQYNYRGKYDSTIVYAVKDVVSYQPTTNDPIKYYFCLTANTGQIPIAGTDSLYWGIVNALSNFPTTVDSFMNHTNIQASDKTDVARFQTLTLQSTLSPSEQDELSNLTVKLRNKLILPEDINALQDSLSNLQMFFNDNVLGYINQKQSEFDAQIAKFTDKGNYLSTTTYQKNNFVTYQGQTYLCTVDNTVNILPSNTSNWRLAAKQGSTGAQGLPGLNLVFKNSYDPTIAYNTGDSVEYGGSIYYCKQSVVGETPQSNGTSWTIFMARASILVSDTAPSSPTDKQVWVDTTTGKFKWYDLATTSWKEVNKNDIDSINNKIGDITTLETTAKDSTVHAINENKENLDNHKADYLHHTGYAVATGSANSYIATLSPALSAYAEGVSLRLKVNVDNTGASTVNVNGLGVVSIKKSDGTDVAAGKLKAGSIYTLSYNGSNFILQGEGGDLSDTDKTNLINSANSLLGS